MSSDADILQGLLRCPRCQKSTLLREEGAWSCPGCSTRFPDVGDVPWLFPDPAAALAEWRARLHALVQSIVREAQSLRRELELPGLHALTRRRLDLLATAQADHALRLQALLAPLGLAGLEARPEVHDAVGTELPMSQDLTSYYVNVHRDWVWGEAENAASLQQLKQVIGAAPLGRTLVLGAGAGRLAYDLHTSCSPAFTLALDLNPLLLLVADRVARGGAVDLHEFPIAPRRLEDHAILRTLRAPAPVDARFRVLGADALRAPFAPRSFDTVVTPWFIDIVPEDFAYLVPRINALLEQGGRWLNFGSLSFAQRSAASCYGREEVEALVAAGGFGLKAIGEARIPYLCSPASRHGREETVLTFAAVKERKVPPPPEHVVLPRWLTHGEGAVPLLPSFEATSLATRIQAFILALIDGERSAADIARYLVEQRLMTAAEAEVAVRTFLTRLYEDSRRRTRF